MKLSFAIFFALIGVICADLSSFSLYNPSAMFIEANRYQANVTALQEDIVSVITGLRSQLSGILKRTSNTTLNQVEDNVFKIFQMDAVVREQIFVVYNRSTHCMVNLRNSLNYETEFTGIPSSNCLSRYDRGVKGLIDTAYDTLAEYEGQISVIQMLVVNAFRGLNIWMEPEDIIERIRNDFDTQYLQWQSVRAEIANYLNTLEADINALNTVLGTCYVAVQTDLAPELETIERQLTECNEFDGIV